MPNFCHPIYRFRKCNLSALLSNLPEESLCHQQWPWFLRFVRAVGLSCIQNSQFLSSRAISYSLGQSSDSAPFRRDPHSFVFLGVSCSFHGIFFLLPLWISLVVTLSLQNSFFFLFKKTCFQLIQNILGFIKEFSTILQFCCSSFFHLCHPSTYPFVSCYL